MKLYFKNKLNTFYFLIIVGLGGLLCFFYYNFQNTKSSTDLVEHTEQVLRLSNEVLLDIITIENGARIGLFIISTDLVGGALIVLEDLRTSPPSGKR